MRPDWYLLWRILLAALQWIAFVLSYLIVFVGLAIASSYTITTVISALVHCFSASCPDGMLMVVRRRLPLIPWHPREIFTSGSRVFKWPFFHAVNYLGVTPFTIDVNLQVLTDENLHINMPCTFVVKSTLAKKLKAAKSRIKDGQAPAAAGQIQARANELAEAKRVLEALEKEIAERFLGLSSRDIRQAVENIIVSRAGTFIAAQKIDDMITRHEAVVGGLTKETNTELEKYDHRLLSLHIKNITDQEGYIEATCKKKAMDAKKKCEDERAKLKKAELKADVVLAAEIEESKARHEAQAMAAKLKIEAEGHGLDLTQQVDAIKKLHEAGITDPEVIKMLLLLENLPEIIAAVPPGITLKDGKEDDQTKAKKSVVQSVLQELLDMTKKKKKEDEDKKKEEKKDDKKDDKSGGNNTDQKPDDLDQAADGGEPQK